ncbi:hypothetical protein GQ457_15G014050 [Hibiscus cannabinus]
MTLPNEYGDRDVKSGQLSGSTRIRSGPGRVRSGHYHVDFKSDRFRPKRFEFESVNSDSNELQVMSRSGSSAFVQDPSLFQEVITTKKDTHKILWLPPPLGSVKFNVDGAVCGGVGSAGIGGILRDSYNRTLILFSKAAGNADATSAELFAIREACFLFQASPWSSSNSLIIECDCSLVVEWFHCSSKAPVIFKQILLECFTICERCSWRVCATSRSCNATADKLAKQGINRVKDMRHVLPLRLPLGDGLKCGLEVFILIM